MSSAEETTRKSGLFSGGLDIRKILLEGRAFFALIAIIIIFTLLSPNYFTVHNILVMSQHVATFAFLGIGMLLVILNGGIDLSVGSTVGLSGVIAGYLLQGVPLSAFGVTLYPSVWVVVVCSVGVGALVGTINGVLVAKFGVAPFVATLGMLYAVRGAALLITDGKTYSDLQGDKALGNTGFNHVGFDSVLGIPMGVLIMIVLAIIGSILLNKTSFGRWLYASGGNERAAKLSGIPTHNVKISVYVISGICAGIAGTVIASELTAANPTTGDTYELTAIATVVIGGASLMGGKGNIRGTLLGAFVIGFLSDGLVIIGVSEYWQMVFTGAVIVFAVMLNRVEYRAKKPKKPSVGSQNDGPAGQPERQEASASTPSS